MRAKLGKALVRCLGAHLSTAVPTFGLAPSPRPRWYAWRARFDSDVHWHVLLQIDAKHDSFGVETAWTREASAPLHARGMLAATPLLASDALLVTPADAWVVLPRIFLSTDEEIAPMAPLWHLAPRRTLDAIALRLRTLDFAEPEVPPETIEAVSRDVAGHLAVEGLDWLRRSAGVEIHASTVPAAPTIDRTLLPRVCPQLSHEQASQTVEDALSSAARAVGAAESVRQRLSDMARRRGRT
jgi:hypothetical protein